MNRQQVYFALLIVLCGGAYMCTALYRNISTEKTETLATPIVTENIKENVPVGKDLLGTASASFQGSTEGREKNIGIGVSRISDKVIMPGEEFSFSDAIGEVKLEDGFSEEKIFLNGEVSKGLGGGLCQLSTTLFRTVLAAGLPVTERHNHTYTVSYYDVGLDATYSNPGPDLKFKNDTGHPIQIKGKVEDKKVVFQIYGVSDGRISSTTEAEITNIKDIPPTRYAYKEKLEEGDHACVNAPQIGYTAEVKYLVDFKDGTHKEQIFKSNYRPLQRVCYVVGVEGLKNFSTMPL